MSPVVIASNVQPIPRWRVRLFFLRRNLGYRLVCRTWGHRFEWREYGAEQDDMRRFTLRCRRCHGVGFCDLSCSGVFSDAALDETLTRTLQRERRTRKREALAEFPA